MNSPITIKNGIESSEKLFAPSTIWRTSTEKFVPVTIALPSVESSIAKEIGTRSSSKSTNPPIKTKPANVAVVISSPPPSSWRQRPLHR